MVNEIKRQTAYKIKIKNLIENPYKKDEGEWAPNYVLIGNKKVSRVNLIATVVSKLAEERQESLLVDDGSDKITVRPFGDDKLTDGFDTGDMALIIGRPREFNSEIYIIPEIIKKIKDKTWFELRKLELNIDNSSKEETKQEDEDIRPDAEEVIDNTATNNYKNIFNKIKELDSGDGADSQEIISACGKDAERIINNLLETGEIFEIRPGSVKVLE